MTRTLWILLALLLALSPLTAMAESHEVDETVASDAKVPFQRFWVKEGFDLDDWTKITVAKVSVDHVEKMEWWQTRAGGDLRPQDLANLADYARQKFELAFTNVENGSRVAYSSAKGPGTLRLETALVEVVPTKLLSSVTPGLPRGSAAIEGRLVDSVSGEVLAKFADRRTAKHRILNLSVDWNSGAKEVISMWAADIARSVNSGAGAHVDSSWNFTLRPW